MIKKKGSPLGDGGQVGKVSPAGNKMTKPVAKLQAPTKEIDAESRLVELKRIWSSLLADIEKRGLIMEYVHNGTESKNPSVQLLLATNAHIRRLQHDLGQVDDYEVDEFLRQKHQDGLFLARKCGDRNCKCVGWQG